MPWWLWVSSGILCMIIEIATPGFFFFSIGLGAIVAGIFAEPFSLPIELVIFSTTTIVSFILMKRFAKALFRTDEVKSNIFALVDKTGIVTKDIPVASRGYVRIEGEEWSAVCEDISASIPAGTMVKIAKTEGNKVIVTPL